MTDLLAHLNPQQRAAVSAPPGPVLVLAGPGSGKTRVLTHRIAYLIREVGVRPWHIVAVTFTNKAAAEMRARAEKLLGGRLDGLQIGTFHAICARLLRIEADALAETFGYPYTRDFAIYDGDDQQAVMRAALADIDIDAKKFTPGRVLHAISAAKNELIAPGDYTAPDYFGEVVRRAYPRYQQRMQQANAMDFDDLLMQTALLLEHAEAVRARYQERFEHILVDEFQDTNQAQLQLIRLLGEPRRNLFVVGDEDQGIYAFRGADYRNVRTFRDTYPDAQVVLLEQNYRSTQVVLDAARQVIDRNSDRTQKRLFTDREGGALITLHEAYTEAEEGEFIARRIAATQRARGLRYADFAIMYRTNAQSRALEEAMVKAHIPYRIIGGLRFYQRQEVKDLLAYLRVVANPNDEVSVKRTLNVPKRGIGETSTAAFLRWAGEQGGMQRALEAAAAGAALPITGRAARGVFEYALLILEAQALARRETVDLPEILDLITTRTGYNLYLHSISETDEQVAERMENINVMRGNMAENADLSLNEYLTETALVADVEGGEEADAVTLLTLHAAKGLEYSIVFLTGLEDGLIPHTRSFSEPDAMAEERRLLYVGLTRAKDELILSYAFRRALYGESQAGIPSRFLNDIAPELLDGQSPKMKGMRERTGYQRQTTWDRPEEKVDAFLIRTGHRDTKIIQFPQAAAARPAPRAEKPLRYRAGMRVMHAKFGVGTVIDSRRSGADDEEVQVKFREFGTKTLAASFAKLQILDEQG
jgi:DNA helicase-2/ATP-dependent DNA helicase PcrA